MRNYTDIIQLLRNIKTTGKQATMCEALIWAYGSARTPYAIEAILINQTEGQISEWIAQLTQQWDGEMYLAGAWRTALNSVQNAQQLDLL